MIPNRWAGRETGASLSNDQCVLNGAAKTAITKHSSAIMVR
jgi:hypothetical protein